MAKKQKEEPVSPARAVLYDLRQRATPLGLTIHAGESDYGLYIVDAGDVQSSVTFRDPDAVRRLLNLADTVAANARRSA